MKGSITKLIISGALLITGSTTVPLFSENVVPQGMKLDLSYVDTCEFQGNGSATSTQIDTRPYIPTCTGLYAVQVLTDANGDIVYDEIPLAEYQKGTEEDGYQKRITSVEYLTLVEEIQQALIPKAQASISRDSRRDDTANAVALSLTITATTSSSTMVVVGVYDQSNNAGGNITGCTYNGSAMTEDAEVTIPTDGAGNASISLNHLIATTTGGTYSITCTRTNNTNSIFVQYSSYLGAHRVTQPDSFAQNSQTTGTTITNTPTSTVSGTYAVSMSRNPSGSFGNSTNFNMFTISSLGMADSNDRILGIGPQNVSATTVNGPSGLISLLIRPLDETPVYPVIYARDDLIISGDLLMY